MQALDWSSIARRGSLVLLAGGLAACSILTSLDGLTGGAGSDGGTTLLEDGGIASSSGAGGGGSGSGGASGSNSGGSGSGGFTTNDGGSSPLPEDGGVAGDSSLPIGPSDSGTPPAAKDAGHDAAPAPAYCASLSPAPFFCDDFDEEALAMPWDQVTDLSGKATLDATYSESPPNAMLSSVNASAASGDVDVAGYKSFTAKQGVAGTYTFALDMRIDSADTSSGSDSVLFALQLWNGSAVWDLELEASYVSSSNDFSLSMSEDSSSGYVSHAASTHFPYKSWGRLAFAITLPAASDGSAPATLTLNGATIASATVKVTTSNPIPEILLGPTYATSTTNGWAIRFDNVTFD